jgi:hydrogenase maturation protein HypF
VISARFHNTIAEMIERFAKRLCGQYHTKKIVLSGGVFQNKFLSGKTTDMLKAGGFSVYVHKNISTTDSGIPVGQIAIANARCHIET